MGGRRFAPAILPPPGDLPIVQLGRGGGDPKSLNVAVWGAASLPQPPRGRVLQRKSLALFRNVQEDNLGEVPGFMVTAGTHRSSSRGPFPSSSKDRQG
jgi:hypothetical protein